MQPNGLAVVEPTYHEPFGARTTASGAVDGTGWSTSDAGYGMGFTGHRHEPQPSLPTSAPRPDRYIDMLGRFYDLRTSQFLTPDPLIRTDIHQYLNPYSYVLNNPVNFVDPFGFEEFIPNRAPDHVRENRHVTVSEWDFYSAEPLDESQTLTASEQPRTQEGGGKPQEPPPAPQSGGIDAHANPGVLSGVSVDSVGTNSIPTALDQTFVSGVDRFHPVVVSRDKRGRQVFEILDLAPEIVETGAGGWRTLLMTALRSALKPYKGTTVLGHALSKHAGRRKDIWGQLVGNQSTWNRQALRHFREIVRGPGEFRRVVNDKGTAFIEKMLPDGRGIRLQLDYVFKGFIDPLP